MGAKPFTAMLSDIISILSGATGFGTMYGIGGFINSKIAGFSNGTVVAKTNYAVPAAVIAGVGYAGLSYGLFKLALRARRYLSEFLVGASAESVFDALWNFGAAATMGKTFQTGTAGYYIMKFLADISGANVFS